MMHTAACVDFRKCQPVCNLTFQTDRIISTLSFVMQTIVSKYL